MYHDAVFTIHLFLLFEFDIPCPFEEQPKDRMGPTNSQKLPPHLGVHALREANTLKFRAHPVGWLNVSKCFKDGSENADKNQTCCFFHRKHVQKQWWTRYVYSWITLNYWKTTYFYLWQGGSWFMSSSIPEMSVNWNCVHSSQVDIWNNPDPAGTCWDYTI